MECDELTEAREWPEYADDQPEDEVDCAEPESITGSSYNWTPRRWLWHR